VKRANTVKLVVHKEVDKKLRGLATWTAKWWDEVNWLRMNPAVQGGEEGRVGEGETR
jgi:putative transposase